MRKRTPVVFLAAVLALSVGNAAAVPYTFTNIADNPSEFADLFFFNSPSLNNSGTVAFVVGQFPEGSELHRDTVAAGRTRLEVGTFIGSGGPVATIAEGSGFDVSPPLSQRQRHCGVLCLHGNGWARHLHRCRRAHHDPL